jgi:glutaredoxin
MGSNVTVYGADSCSDCRRAKQYLDTNGIAFDWVDVEASPDEVETIMGYNDGRNTIPVIVFADGSHLTEPSNAELAVKLGFTDSSHARR